jgi:hypothetical protein
MAENPATGWEQALFRAVPPGARKVLGVGLDKGPLWLRLLERDPRRQISFVRHAPRPVNPSGAGRDQDFLDIEHEDVPLHLGGRHCVLFADVLQHLADPASVLRRYRDLLAPGGLLLCSAPNAQHHTSLTALLTSDWPPRADEDVPPLRNGFTYSALLKVLLDAGYAPSGLRRVRADCPPALLEAAGPLLRYLGLHPGRTATYLGALHYIVQGTAYPADSPPPQAEVATTEEPLTFAVCASDEPTLKANLLASPCLAPGTPHQVIRLHGCATAAEGLNRALADARHPLVVCLHQDVYLPRGWPQRFLQQYRQAERQFGPIGVAGVYGATRDAAGPAPAGHVIDRQYAQGGSVAMPARVETLDELLLAVPKAAGLTFEPRLGFHFYGADICLAARKRGLAAVVLDALCFHNSRSVALPPAFYDSGSAFAAKWADQLPVATSCGQIDPQGQVRVYTPRESFD